MLSFRLQYIRGSGCDKRNQRGYNRQCINDDEKLRHVTNCCQFTVFAGTRWNLSMFPVGLLEKVIYSRLPRLYTVQLLIYEHIG